MDYIDLLGNKVENRTNFYIFCTPILSAESY